MNNNDDKNNYENTREFFSLVMQLLTLCKQKMQLEMKKMREEAEELEENRQDWLFSELVNSFSNCFQYEHI